MPQALLQLIVLRASNLALVKIHISCIIISLNTNASPCILSSITLVSDPAIRKPYSCISTQVECLSSSTLASWSCGSCCTACLLSILSCTISSLATVKQPYLPPALSSTSVLQYSKPTASWQLCWSWLSLPAPAHWPVLVMLSLGFRL